MKTIRDLLARDLDQKIEEIISFTQQNEASVYTELTEYVATDCIREQYRQLLQAIADAPAEPHEGMGIWISGFFGSGKSSFAKNLGYVLANRQVLGHQASDLFKQQLNSPQLGDLIDFINTRIPTEVIMFDVSVDRAARKGAERIAEVMYSVLLRELGYAEDYDVAELEISLEADGQLDEFSERFENKYAKLFGEQQGQWSIRRKMSGRFNESSAILHEMDSSTYPQPDSWARSLAGKGADITVRKLVERTFELTARRRPGKAVVFIIDEVGQYVARSADKILDLQAVVREFGPVSKNKVKTREAIAPVWIIVTSQEKLDEVVAAIDSKRVELAKLQDSFKYHIDLAPADIREVATRRVLAKKAEAVPVLNERFAKCQGQLNTLCRLERTSRKSDVNEADFVKFYPYLPHYVELSIDIMSGIRLQPGAPKHLGGSNRTIIKQAYEMLVSERTHFADESIGTLVTLDKIFELVEGNLSTERQKDISDIAQRFSNDPWGARVAKAVCLLEFVRDLPRTEANLAAVLYGDLDSLSPIQEIRRALYMLAEAQFVRHTEEGYKLQTAQEKNWDTERRSLDPKPKDRNEILREIIGDLFSDPRLRTYRFENLRNFRVSASVNGAKIGDEGQVPVSVHVANDEDERKELSERWRFDSNGDLYRNTIFWIVQLTPELDNLIVDLYRSRQMVAKYEQLRGQSKITPEESSLLASEKNEVLRIQNRLREKIAETLKGGVGYFRGVSKDGAGPERSIGDVFKNLFDFAVPDLYPKLRMGARPLKGNEAEEILKAVHLNALPQVFYGSEQGLNLVIKEGARFAPNPSTEVAKEILDYIKRQHAYGEKITGRDLEAYFQGIGYGWERDMLRLVLAVLLRAGSVEVTHQGRRFRNHQDPQCRVPFTNNQAFRAASFAPRESIDLKTLTTAVQHFEALTGEEVDVEEAAIATAFQKLAADERQALHSVEAVAQAHHLPVVDILDEYRTTLQTILDSPSDDCVRILAGEGKSFQGTREKVWKIREATSEDGLKVLDRARTALGQMWPVVEQRAQDHTDSLHAVKLRADLESSEFYESRSKIKSVTEAIERAYRTIYEDTHEQRTKTFEQAVEEIKGRSEWADVPEEIKEPTLAPLTSRTCHSLDLPVDIVICRNCSATIPQMESDLAAVTNLRAQVLQRVRELTAPGEKVERIRVSDFFKEALDSEESVREALGRLQDHLMKLIAEGMKVVLE